MLPCEVFSSGQLLYAESVGRVFLWWPSYPMNGKRVAATFAGGTLFGVAVGKLTPGDLAELLKQIISGSFAFLKEQGEYASFAIVMAVGFGWLSVWCIRLLVDGKQAEIDRVSKERDKFQKLFIDDWQSSKNDFTKGEKGIRRK